MLGALAILPAALPAAAAEPDPVFAAIDAAVADLPAKPRYAPGTHDTEARRFTLAGLSQWERVMPRA